MINLENRRILILIAMICHIVYVGHHKSGLVAAVALHLFMMWRTHRRLKKLRLAHSPKASSDQEMTEHYYSKFEITCLYRKNGFTSHR
jgi:hypothetical protein